MYKSKWMSCFLAMTLLLAPITGQRVYAQETSVEETTNGETSVDSSSDTTTDPEGETSSQEEIPEDLLSLAIQEGYGYDPAYTAKSAILVDADTGQIVWGQDIDLELDPASMSKVMTAYLVYQAIEEGKLTMDQVHIATEEDAAISWIVAASNNIMTPGLDYTVEELLYYLFFPSSNVATILLGRLVAGNDTAFVDLMNKTAKEMGMDHTHFNNAGGAMAYIFEGLYQPEGYDAYASNISTARDMATLGYHILKDYPQVLEITSQYEVTIKPGTVFETPFESYNTSIPGGFTSYEGVDGLKTGSSPTAGFNILSTAKRGNTRFIEVVMGVGTWEQPELSSAYRNIYGNALYDWGFRQFESKDLLQAGKQTINGQEVTLETGLKDLVRIGQTPNYVIEGNQVKVQSDLQALQSNISQPVALIHQEQTQEAPPKGIQMPKLSLDGHNKWMTFGLIVAGSSLLALLIVAIRIFIQKKKQ